MNLPPDPHLHALPVPQPNPGDAQEWLSALADGEVIEPTHGVRRATEQWAHSPAVRQRWHTYHLIGDVMRSDELASAPDQDAAFMIKLRARLADEPVLLAPMPMAAVTSRRQAWWTPAAVAAGFMAVAAVLVVARLGQPGADPAAAPALAFVPAPALSAAGNSGAPANPSAPNQAVLRDARLDSYLRAHQAARQGGAAAVPGGGLRNVDVVVPGGAQR